jgi:hypothetical protein
MAAEGLVVLNSRASLSSSMRERDAIIVTYVAGYEDVPEDLKLGNKAMVFAAYESRCAVSIDAGRAYLEAYRVWWL